MALALCPGPPFGPLRLGARTRLPKSLATWRSPQRRVERLRRSFAGEPLRSSRLSRRVLLCVVVVVLLLLLLLLLLVLLLRLLLQLLLVLGPCVLVL